MNVRIASFPQPPAGRRHARREARREAILDVATRYFLEHGYAGATMSGIAAALGGSKGTLWSYFPAKDLLFTAVIDRQTEAFRAQLSLTLTAREGVEAALRRFCAEFLRRVTSNDAIALHRLVVGEGNRFPQVGRIFFERGPRQTQQLLAGFLRDAMARGLLRGDDPLTAARQLIGLCMYGCHLQLLMGVIDTVSAELIEADVDRTMATFLATYLQTVAQS